MTLTPEFLWTLDRYKCCSLEKQPLFLKTWQNTIAKRKVIDPEKEKQRAKLELMMISGVVNLEFKNERLLRQIHQRNYYVTSWVVLLEYDTRKHKLWFNFESAKTNDRTKTIYSQRGHCTVQICRPCC
ncbi:uncharacterized protein [Cicer arietinum]|uniref:Uncharacterized protein LOC101497338 isoform X2 n=1 Tax=Cicer arietinum TaxID=3827 RepID=A0A3Q7XUY7_CICAR|nr:uncharacterized protein LOC101497338 isoform X2 [Cicer arietinum]